MKLFLTSASLTNKTLVSAFESLVELNGDQVKIAFIPTAANVEEGDKDWLITDLQNLQKQGYKEIDIVDISAIEKDQWLPRLEAADVLFFGGGNTFHLMYWLKKSGLDQMLPDLLKTRVYAGISAGSMVTGKRLITTAMKLYYADLGQYKDENGLDFVPLSFRPHLNTRFFPEVRKDVLEKYAKEIDEPLYALDDQSALKIVDGKIEVVTEGEYLIFNQ